MVQVEGVQGIRRDEVGEFATDQFLPFGSEHRGRGQIGLQNRGITIQRQVADRREVVEMAKLFVLQLQLDLMKLKFMHQLFDFLRRHLGNVRTTCAQGRFGALAQAKRGFRKGDLFRHDCSPPGPGAPSAR
jgi:hypothetical protein